MVNLSLCFSRRGIGVCHRLVWNQVGPSVLKRGICSREVADLKGLFGPPESPIPGSESYNEIMDRINNSSFQEGVIRGRMKQEVFEQKVMSRETTLGEVKSSSDPELALHSTEDGDMLKLMQKIAKQNVLILSKMKELRKEVRNLSKQKDSHS